MSHRTCSVEDCDRPHRGQGFCSIHYKRWYRYGDPVVQKHATHTVGVDQAFKKAWVIEYKMSRGCSDCGYRAHHAALDFDHRPGTVKVRDIKSGQQLGWEALQEEVAKCDVVCACCHRIRTWARRGGDVNEYVVFTMAST